MATQYDLGSGIWAGVGLSNLELSMVFKWMPLVFRAALEKVLV